MLSDIIDTVLQFIPVRNSICLRRVSKQWKSVISDKFLARCINIQYGHNQSLDHKSIVKTICWLTERQYYEKIYECSNGNLLITNNSISELVDPCGTSIMNFKCNCCYVNGYIYNYRDNTSNGSWITCYDENGKLLFDEKIEKFIIHNTDYPNPIYLINSTVFTTRSVRQYNRICLVEELKKISDKYYIAHNIDNYLYDENFKIVKNTPHGYLEFIFDDGFVVFDKTHKYYNNDLQLCKKLYFVGHQISSENYVLNYNTKMMSLYHKYKKLFTINTEREYYENDFSHMEILDDASNKKSKKRKFMLLSTSSGYFIKFDLDGNFIKYWKVDCTIMKFHVLKNGRIVYENMTNEIIIDL